ncbi:MAG: fatty acid--CoA ligase [Steroidobacteraceae bacterium]
MSAEEDHSVRGREQGSPPLIETLADIPRVYARLNPQHPALEFEGRSTTYAELDARASQVARALIADGVRPGDRIAHLGKNTDLYVELLLGAAKAGAVMTPVNWRLAPPEWLYMINDSDAKILFVGPEFIGAVEAAAAELQVRQVIGMESPYKGRSYREWRDAQPSDDPRVPIEKSAAALQLYTSGTTGHPKGAVLSNSNLCGMPQESGIYEWSRWHATDVNLIAMPCFHIGGTGWAILGLINGAQNIVAREFDPTKVLDYIETWRITKLFLVPVAMQVIVRLPKARQVDYSQLKYIMYGASPMPLALLRECMDVFGCGFVQLYGMTETTGSVTALAPEDHDVAGNPRMSSAGKALPGVEIVILDADGTRLPPGKVGEVVVRSPANMQGYWKLPQATAKTIGEDNWLRTGDAGYLDEQGYLYIHDRVKDMIISGGENIYPAEVENAIYGHPDVGEVAVIGIPSESWGEEVKAFVALKPGKQPDQDSIIAWARERIASYKVPKSIDFIEALPRNASGKILRRQLREPYWKGRERQVN